MAVTLCRRLFVTIFLPSDRLSVADSFGAFRFAALTTGDADALTAERSTRRWTRSGSARSFRSSALSPSSFMPPLAIAGVLLRFDDEFPPPGVRINRADDV